MTGSSAQPRQGALRHAVKNLQTECSSMLDQFDEAKLPRGRGTNGGA